MKPIKHILLPGAMVFSLAACGGTTASGEDEATEITIAHGASESLHMHQAWLEFERILEETGDYDVEIYPGSQFGNDEEMVESAKLGDVTIATPPSSFLGSEAPNMQFIELPYVFPDREAAVATLEGEWGQQQLTELEDDGIVGMGYLENGIRHLTNNSNPIQVPADVDGLTLRTMQVPAHVYLWNELGATAEGAPFAEVYTNLSTGRFDGQENPVSLIHSQRFNEVQDYMTLTGHVYTAYVPVMNQSFWEDLSSEEQGVVSDAFDEAKELQLELVVEQEETQLEEISSSTEYPTEVTTLTDDERQQWIEAAQPTLDNYSAELGEDAYSDFTSAVEEASGE